MQWNNQEHGASEPSSQIARQLREDSLQEFCEELFAPLSRRDQRRWGWMYVRGLLLSAGRKSMRNIAATAHQPASQQNLQQFVSKSTWDWQEVRQRLARVLCRHLKATAWVLSPLVIPKSGNNTVGVDTQFVSHLGRLVNCQQALGVWFVKPGVSCPMDWRLILPTSWTDDPIRRRRAAIPVEVKNAPAWEHGVDALITMINDWGLPMRPAVMDVRQADAAEIIGELQRLHMPFIVRVNRAARFVRARRTGPRKGGEDEYTADSLARILKGQRRVVQWHDGERGGHQGVLAAAIHVNLPEAELGVSDPDNVFVPIGMDMPPMQRALVLIAEWRDSVQGKPAFWVSNITSASVPTLLGCANLTRQVYRDQEQISRRIGLYDFEGRSFGGWHRHVTLVSAAHAYISLNRLNGSFNGTSEAKGEIMTRHRESPWQEV
ncbi:transposase [Spongiactinospora sp. TRM90649]|uniref:IS701 family transposase n=1 Tax=Spongiactinospora sp. TRM90649 TaxID=3031114 RepID=UPI0023F99B23|nr:transposase [Spongiactinospora sp. TRM90649]MDF5752081.1 transposase [Spongiactinospora sp. TRM90649]